ncbi:MAG: protein-L-isoaspartate O-methyltransferase [Gammaproteobacteria bacterium]|nr:protein-L-isoaspartate O-methyltransferase [Gammaproteobacteria bacterium]
MDFELARHNMVEQQIRTWEVLDPAVLELFETLHREDFVPAEYRRLALADINIPLSHAQVTMAPRVEARVLQTLGIQRSDRALEVGTGCGFFTALLGCCAAQVHSVDIFPEFTQSAAPKLARYGIGNVHLHTGNAAQGWAQTAPYDIIVLTGSVPILPDAFQEQLAPGGRLFAIVGQSPVMAAQLITHASAGAIRREILFETDLPPLLGLPIPSAFRF